MSNKLPLTNVVRVTVLSGLKGLANKNTSVLAIFTTDQATVPGFGTYGIYKDPVAVANDFGSSSDVYAMCVAIFAQSPNILSANGYVVIIPLLTAAAASAATMLSTGFVDLTQLTATDYKIKLAVDGGSAAELAIGQLDLTSLATAQASLNSTAVSGAGATFSLSGTLTACRIQLVSDTTGASSELAITATGTGTDIAPLLGLSGTQNGTAAGAEAIRDAILRTYNTIDYFGVLVNSKPADAALLNLAALCQSIDKMYFVASSASTDIAGVFTNVKNASYTNTRCLLYTKSTTDAVNFAAGYAGRALSVLFTGVDTVHTMHLKTLVSFDADPTLTQTMLTNAQNAGVDVYADFGEPKLFTSGENGYFDAVYISLAFKFSLQVAGFNTLAGTPTKIAQTEAGMTLLKKAYRGVCLQFVANGAFAPGEWLSSTTFGNPEDTIRNIADFGFYIYSPPVASQTAEERAARVAPQVQIAAKSSGAIHSSDVVAYIEA